MLGESLEADIEGALNVGMQAVHFMPLLRKNPTPNKEIEQLDEWLSALRSTWESRLDRLDVYLTTLQSKQEDE